jgi:hypothetical protein
LLLKPWRDKVWNIVLLALFQLVIGMQLKES